MTLSVSRGRAAIIGVAGVVVLGAAAGTAYAADGSGTSTAGTAITAAGHAKANHAKHRRPIGLAARSLHSAFTIKTKAGYVTVDTQRGTISATDGKTLTVTSKDNHKQAYGLDSATKVRLDGKKSTASALKSSDTVVVVTSVKQGVGTAGQVVARTPGYHPAKKPATPQSSATG